MQKKFIILIIFIIFLFAGFLHKNSKPHTVYYPEINISYVDNGDLLGTVDEAILINLDNSIFSFLQYAHTNGEATFQDDGTFEYNVDGINYLFDYDNFSEPEITFQINGETYRLYNDKKNIIIQKVSKWHIFISEQTICSYQNHCFYSPISIAGLNTYAIITEIPGIDNTLDKLIAVYILDDGKWRQVEFVMPNGDTTKLFDGFARRKFNNKTVGYIDDDYIGNLELCQQNIENPTLATLYCATYSNGSIQLYPTDTYMYEALKDWKF